MIKLKIQQLKTTQIQISHFDTLNIKQTIKHNNKKPNKSVLAVIANSSKRIALKIRLQKNINRINLIFFFKQSDKPSINSSIFLNYKSVFVLSDNINQLQADWITN
ncbi:hypothetical protein ABPG74_012523 [Tetrahymena malaccensis]